MIFQTTKIHPSIEKQGLSIKAHSNHFIEHQSSPMEPIPMKNEPPKSPMAKIRKYPKGNAPDFIQTMAGKIIKPGAKIKARK